MKTRQSHHKQTIPSKIHNNTNSQQKQTHPHKHNCKQKSKNTKPPTKMITWKITQKKVPIQTINKQFQAKSIITQNSQQKQTHPHKHRHDCNQKAKTKKTHRDNQLEDHTNKTSMKTTKTKSLNNRKKQEHSKSPMTQ